MDHGSGDERRYHCHVCHLALSRYSTNVMAIASFGYRRLYR
jgi:hypothetical protein